MNTAAIHAIGECDEFYELSPKFQQDKQTALPQHCWIIYAQRFTDVFLQALQSNAPSAACGWQVGHCHVQLFFCEGAFVHAALCDKFQVDYANLANLPNLNLPGLALFDMDSTAIEIECIDEIAKAAGVGAQVALITERAMQGELDFSQSLRERVALLKGVDLSVLEQIRDNLPLMSGMKMLCKTLQHYGWQVAIASGGFTWFSDKLKQELDLCFAASNQLVIENGKLTGELSGEIVDAKQKAHILSQLAARYDLPLTQTIAVGDGANDLPMLAQAGMGIAYHAKPAVERQAQVAVRYADLTGVLCVLSASLFLYS